MAKTGVWISVKDGLPKKDCNVKVTNERKGSDVWDVFFEIDSKCFKLYKEGTWNTSYPLDVTHYMVMPLTPAIIAKRKREEAEKLKECAKLKACRADEDDEDEEDTDEDDE